MKRALSRALSFACAGSLAFAGVVGSVALDVTLGGSPAAAAASTYTVSSSTDSAGSCNNITGVCTSLRAAVAAANADPGSTISLGAGTYTLTLGELALTKAVTITGAAQQPGASATTISGNNSSRVFNVSAPAPGANVDGVVVTKGANAHGNGGGIVVNSGAVLTLTHSTVTANTASQGAGIEVDGTATIAQSTINANTASAKGGGVYVAGTLT